MTRLEILVGSIDLRLVPRRLDLPLTSNSRSTHFLFFITVSTIVAMAIDNIVTDPALKLALETSAQTREQAIALLDLVSSHPPTSEASHEFQIQISRQQKLLLTYLAQLRGLHRDSLVGARETKALTAEARQEVDKLHLQLQNLYYEQRHLQGEILACESYE